MEYDIDVDDVCVVILIHFHGESTLQGHYEARDDAANLLRERSIRRVLVDLTESSFPKIDTMSQFLFAESLPKIFPIGTRVAIVAPSSNEFERSFAENVATNRGVPARSFRGEAEALSWLCES